MPYTGTYGTFSCDSQRSEKKYFKSIVLPCTAAVYNLAVVVWAKNGNHYYWEIYRDGILLSRVFKIVKCLNSYTQKFKEGFDIDNNFGGKGFVP